MMSGNTKNAKPSAATLRFQRMFSSAAKLDEPAAVEALREGADMRANSVGWRKNRSGAGRRA